MATFRPSQKMWLQHDWASLKVFCPKYFPKCWQRELENQELQEVRKGTKENPKLDESLKMFCSLIRLALFCKSKSVLLTGCYITRCVRVRGGESRGGSSWDSSATLLPISDWLGPLLLLLLLLPILLLLLLPLPSFTSPLLPHLSPCQTSLAPIHITLNKSTPTSAPKPFFQLLTPFFNNPSQWLQLNLNLKHLFIIRRATCVLVRTVMPHISFLKFWGEFQRSCN